MNERRDDTTPHAPTEPDAGREPLPPARRYYEDDATGYEVYDPQAVDPEPDDAATDNRETGDAAQNTGA